MPRAESARSIVADVDDVAALGPAAAAAAAAAAGPNAASKPPWPKIAENRSETEPKASMSGA